MNKSLIASDANTGVAVDEFMEQVKMRYPILMKSTSTDDELVFAMMSSLGRMADLFRSGDVNLAEARANCIQIAAAAMCIGCPYEAEDTTTQKPISNTIKLAPAPKVEQVVEKVVEHVDEYEEDDIPPEVIESSRDNSHIPNLVSPLGSNSSVFAPLMELKSRLPRKEIYIAPPVTREPLFFVYKHHSYGMTLKLEGWIREHIQEDEFGKFKCCGVDRNQNPLIGIIHSDGSMMAFIKCSTPQVKAACEDFLRANYPNKEWV